MLDNNDVAMIQQMIQASIREELKQLQMKEEDISAVKLSGEQKDSMNIRVNMYHEALQKTSKNQRKAKVLFTNAGGNASKGSQTTRITLPITWVREMGITPENREVDISFQDGKIIIEKK